MEDTLPYLDVVRHLREGHKVKEVKRKQIETRTALKNISNKSSASTSKNESTKKMRLTGIENKENLTKKTSKGILANFREHFRPRELSPESGISNEIDPFSVSSLSSSQSSQDKRNSGFMKALSNFLNTDFALNLALSNPSEKIFEVPEYVVDIYFREQEREMDESNRLYDFFSPRLPPGTEGPELVAQTEISKEILCIVVDWMVEVQENMEMNHETFYLAVIMMYRFMSITPGVSKKTIQLLACTAMWLASKYEERVSPAVREFMYICDDAFSAKDFISMEQKLFFALDETCHRPISYVFLRRYSRVADGDNMQMQFLSRYYLELTLQNQSLMLNRESLKAAGALWLARTTLKFGGNRWPSVLRFFTRYEEGDMMDFVVKLYSFAKEVPHSNLQTTYIKYGNKVFLEVATIPQLPERDFEDLVHTIRSRHKTMQEFI